MCLIKVLHNEPEVQHRKTVHSTNSERKDSNIIKSLNNLKTGHLKGDV